MFLIKNTIFYKNIGIKNQLNLCFGLPLGFNILLQNKSDPKMTQSLYFLV